MTDDPAAQPGQPQPEPALLAPFVRIGANATGNGRWFEGYLCGLLPPPTTAGILHINPEGCTPPIAAPNQGVGGR